jgi:hypothetical protein
MWTMQRARRPVLLAVLALVGTLALTGCRSQPSTALYVGGTSYSQKYVDGLADQLQKVSPASFSRGDGRQTIAQWLVERDLGKRMVADKHWPAPEVDEQSATAQIQDALQAGGNGDARAVEPLRPLIKLYAEYAAYRGAVQQHATPARPTDADYADLYQRFRAAGMLPPDVTEAKFRTGLSQQDQQMILPNLAMRNLYSEAVRKANVTVNPKYGLAELQLLKTNDNHPIVVVPFDAKAGQPAVVPAPVEQSQSPGNG